MGSSSMSLYLRVFEDSQALVQGAGLGRNEGGGAGFCAGCRGLRAALRGLPFTQEEHALGLGLGLGGREGSDHLVWNGKETGRAA